ncbi:molecular chaperone DnaJ [Bartonella sp. DGB2]|uniref:molecular chaperone DnaJ n=1 Tax=Bartonella sp. DGB2 TaxID=3388426 RepID=UPI00398FD287
MKVDYYEMLGVSRDCDEKTLKSAFRKLAMRYHPDRNPDDKEAEHKFKEIGEAYEVLKDPQKRAAYDRYGHAAFENGGRGNGGFGGGFRAHGGFSDIFEDFFGEMMGGGRRRRDGRERGADLSYNMEISLEEAYQGKEAHIRLPVSKACDVCSGTGAKAGAKPKTCITCHGAGRVKIQSLFTMERTCPTCQGRGAIITDPCEKCHGHGRVEEERSLKVDIPAGIDDGTRIRLRGEGEAGLRGGESGDLYIFLSITPHEIFRRDGADLHCQVPLSMITAALGGEFEVSTLGGGKSRVSVTEGTENGQYFRLRGKGMPVMNQSLYGDLYIQVMVETPQNLTKKQRELLQEFQKISNDENSPQSHGFFARMKEFFEKNI